VKPEIPERSSESHFVDHLARLTQWTTVCARALNRLFAGELAEVDISPAEFMLLWICSQSRSSAISQKQLASITGTSPAQVCQTAERLRERGWIVLIRCSADRRRQSLEMTPAGAEKLQTACEQLNEPAKRIVGDSGNVMPAEVVALLRKLAPSFQEYSVPSTLQAARSGSDRKEAA